jgi:hypothetical protein
MNLNNKELFDQQIKKIDLFNQQVEKIIFANDFEMVKQKFNSNDDLRECLVYNADKSFFIDSISYFDNVEIAQFFLSVEFFLTQDLFDKLLIKSAELNSVKIVQFLLKNRKMLKEHIMYDSLRICLENNHTETLKLFLKDPLIKPEKSNNLLSWIANSFDSQECLYLLWMDERVKSTLQESNPVIFDQLTAKKIKNTIHSF